MLHVVNLAMLQASTPYHPDGRPRDPHAHHRQTIAALHRQARRQAFAARLGWLSRLWALGTGRLALHLGPAHQGGFQPHPVSGMKIETEKPLCPNPAPPALPC